jgi:hypothetical protein
MTTNTEKTSPVRTRRFGGERRDHLLVGGAALLTVLALFLEGPEPPDDGASAAEVRSFWEGAIDGRALQAMGELLAVVGIIGLTVGLRSLARRHRGDPLLLDLSLLSGALVAVWMFAQSAVDMVPVVAADDEGTLDHYPDATLLAMDFVARLGETFGDVATAPRGLFLLAVSLLALQTRMLPRWLAWFGLVVAAASLVAVLAVAVPSAALAVVWFVGLFGFLLWTLVLGVTGLVKGGRRPRSA